MAIREHLEPPAAPEPTAPVPGRLWTEWRIGLETARLAVAAPSLRRLPDGRGAPALLIPGWKAPELTMSPLRLFLRARGFDARHWGFGTNLGAPPHFAARRLEQAVLGSAFNYVQSGGGQKRYALLIGGHIDVAIFSVAEFTAYRGDGKIRAVAVLREELSNPPR